ncbi:helix-turn-helix transcriptional regulator [Streptomyces carpaticus]|uniref:helix-turn-helix transcriptional regulator n=1 Tax=Streptomyces carpaticus TaxID=285558 RepID=UPI0031F91DFC
MPESSEPRYDAAIGQRIQAIRVQRGLTQQGLAQRAHLSYSAITKVESGHRPATPAVTAACARALRVPVTDLTGQPFTAEMREDQLEEMIQPLRAIVASPLLPVEAVQPRTAAALLADVEQLDAARLRADYLVVGTAAPPLLDELLTLAEEKGAAREQLYDRVSFTYRLASAMAYKFGYHDLSLLALERADQAAQRAADPFSPAAVAEARSKVLLSWGQHEVGQAEIARGEAIVADAADRGDVRALSLRGSLHLKRSIVHARRRSQSAAADASAHLAEAREIAGRIAGTPDPYGLVFDATNVGIHAVGVALDQGDAGAAVEESAKVHLPKGWAASRSSRHHLDLARAHERLGNEEEALKSLTAARTASAIQTRYHPGTRETVLALLRKRRTAAAPLASFARWVGV